MPAHKDRPRGGVLDLEFANFSEKPVVPFAGEPLFARKPITVSAEVVRLRDAIEQIGFHLSRQPADRAVTDTFPLVIKLTRLQMIFYQLNYLAANVVTVKSMNVESIEERNCRFDAGRIVSVRAPPAVQMFGSCGFAQIVTQGAQHHGHLLRIW